MKFDWIVVSVRRSLDRPTFYLIHSNQSNSTEKKYELTDLTSAWHHVAPAGHNVTSVSRDDWYWTSRVPDQREFIDYAAINIHRIPGILVLIIILWVIIYESQSLDYVKAICFCIINNCSPSIVRVSALTLRPSIGRFECSMNVYGALRFKTFECFRFDR